MPLGESARRAIAVLLTCACALAALPREAGAEVGVTKDEILIGACATLKQDIGRAEYLGATAYVQYVNDVLGGVNGRKIRVLFGDDDFTADGAAQCYARMRKEGVFALAFLATGAEVVQYIKLATADKIPVVSAANGSPFMYEPVKRYFFAMRSTYTQEAYQLTDALQQRLRARRIAAIYMSDGLGFTALAGVRKAVADHGATLVAEASFLRNAQDMEPAVKAARAANPDAVVILGNYRQAADILKAAQKEHWKTTFSLVTAREAVVNEAGSAAEGLIMALLYPHPSRTDLPTVALFQKLMRQYHPDARPDVKMLEGFSHAVLLVKALGLSGARPTRERLVQTLESMHGVDLGLGDDYRVSFSSSNHQGFSHADFSIVRNGESVPLTDWTRR